MRAEALQHPELDFLNCILQKPLIVISDDGVLVVVYALVSINNVLMCIQATIDSNDLELVQASNIHALPRIRHELRIAGSEERYAWKKVDPSNGSISLGALALDKLPDLSDIYDSFSTTFAPGDTVLVRKENRFSSKHYVVLSAKLLPVLNEIEYELIDAKLMMRVRRNNFASLALLNTNLTVNCSPTRTQLILVRKADKKSLLSLMLNLKS
jgi:hypothetical protein